MTDVYASGPIEFTDNSSGKQLSIPLTAISVEDIKAGILPNWPDPDYTTNKDKVGALLEHLYSTGIITPAPQASPKPAMVIKAINPGPSGNNIQVTFSNPNDTIFDVTVTETDTYTLLTPATIQDTLGTDPNSGKQPGLVYVSSSSVSGLPKKGNYPLSTDQVATADIPNTGGGPAFSVNAKRPGTDGADKTVSIDDVNTVTGTFKLVATWTKTVKGIKAQDLEKNFADEIKVGSPREDGTLLVPAAGTITLSGGADARNAVEASATVVANS